MRQKVIHAINFNSGVTIYFLSYSQDETDLQAGTVYGMFCDEELPEGLWGELQARLRATRGYYHQVFTATLGQELWRATIEEKGKLEKFPRAFKRQISMYDCQVYIDGSLSPWTDERILEEVDRCGSQTEVERRIHGKFVVEGGLKYSGFDRTRNVGEDHRLPKGWHIYTAVDIGSGGQTGHPAAIVFLGVSPDYKKGRVFKCWRGDGIETTASDVLDQYIKMRGNMKPIQQFYDWASKDFEVIARRRGEAFSPAEKKHETGEQILNTLFKNIMLKIYDNPEGRKLISELVTLKEGKKKSNTKDDLVDALRYVVTGVPWDYVFIGDKIEVAPEKKELLDPREEFIRDRNLDLKLGRGIVEQSIDEQMDIIANELEEWDNIINEEFL